MRFLVRNSRLRWSLCVLAFAAACGSSPALDEVGPADGGAADTLSDPSPARDVADTPLVDTGLVDTGLVDTGPVDAGSDATPDAGPALPSALSEAGLFIDGVGGEYAAGVRSYDVRFPLWTDGAEKLRHMLLPAGSAIDTRDPDGWVFPVGTRLFKEFRVEGVPVETRLLWKFAEDSWTYVAYRYRADGSDADPVPEGEENVRSTMHDVPSQSQCRNCHTGGADFVLGVGAIQLDDATWNALVEDGVLDAGTVRGEPPGTPVEQEALGYLHANCGHCHSDNHFAGTVRALRLWLPVGLAAADDAPAWQTTVGIAAFHELEGTRVLVVPGNAEESQLLLRMSARGDLQMPPLGTELADPRGMEAVRAWIER